MGLAQQVISDNTTRGDIARRLAGAIGERLGYSTWV